MKKLFALAIVAGFALSFAACSGKKAEEAPAEEAAPATEQPAQDTTQQASDTTQQQ